MRPKRVISIVVALMVLLMLSMVIFAWKTPPLRMRVAAGAVYVDVQSLGEYPTDVERLRLVDVSTGTVVWELRARGAAAQLSTFELHAGANPAVLQYVRWGKVDVVTPKNAATFEIKTDQSYTLEVWGTRLPMTRRRRTFTISGSER